MHKFTWTSKDAGDCGSHGCSGHTDYKVECLCGWTKEFPGRYFGRPDNEETLMLQHRLDYLESKLLGADNEVKI